MTTFNFAKDVDDIEQPVPIEEDWYVASIVKAPEIKPNKKKQEGKSYEGGAGDNMVISLRLLSEDDYANGRAFTLWLPFPSEEDMENYDGRGMLKYDAKMERLIEFATAAKGCTADGDSITILPNGRIGIYVSQGLDQQGNDIVNSIDWFQGFKDPDDIGLPEGFGDELPGSSL